MKKSIKFVIASIVITLLICLIVIILVKCSNKADKVIYGNVYTGVSDSLAEAVAIKNDKIIYVGSKDGIKKYINKKTEILNYENDFILSGFTDTHTHVTPSFGTSEYLIDLRSATTVEEYIQIIKDYIASHPDEEMYVGMGWNYMLFENGAPSKKILDEIESEKPIYIKSGDGHSCWINSKMIEKIGVTKETENPIGGTIVKDENGEIGGCFKDAAMDLLVKPYVKPFTVEQYKNLIMKAQEYYASLGYSSYVEVLVEPDATNYNLYKAYEELDKEGKLLLRVNCAWNVPNNENTLNLINQIIEYKNESKGGMFELTDIKIFMDGVAETKTAYFSEPYADEIDNYGADRWPGQESFNLLVDAIELANRNDMVVHFHAIGDAAITKALDAVEESRKRYVNDNIHNVITHLETVKESDIERFAKLDVIVSANLSWGCKTDDLYQNVEVKYLGEKRASSAYPYKTVLDAGAVVSSATDYPAGPIASPIASFIVAVNRNATVDETNVRDASQKMTPKEALNALTYAGAYQMGQENYRGTIEVNKKADFIVLDNNLLENHEVTNFYTKVLLNVVNGKTVYKAK